MSEAKKSKKRPGTDTPAGGGAGGVSEETKAKFRAALDRKQAHDGVGDEGSADRGKVSRGHGPAAQQKMFRRKAGG